MVPDELLEVKGGVESIVYFLRITNIGLQTFHFILLGKGKKGLGDIWGAELQNLSEM